MTFTRTQNVAFIRRDFSKDSEGFPVIGERLLGCVPAQIEWRATTDRWQNNASLKEASAIVRLRAPSFSPRTDDILVIRGLRYNIQSIENVRSKNRWLVLIVQEVPNG